MQYALIFYDLQLILAHMGDPLPSSHTTVRTGPYTAVHVDRCPARSCSSRLRSPHSASNRVVTAACIGEAPAFHQAPRPVAVAFCARSASMPSAINFR